MSQVTTAAQDAALFYVYFAHSRVRTIPAITSILDTEYFVVAPSVTGSGSAQRQLRPLATAISRELRLIEKFATTPRINKCSNRVEWLRCYVGEPGVHCSCHRLFLFSLSAAPCRLSSASLIPMTRGITSVAADDSALTSLVARSMGVN